jgi:hypothetical protein
MPRNRAAILEARRRADNAARKALADAIAPIKDASPESAEGVVYAALKEAKGTTRTAFVAIHREFKPVLVAPGEGREGPIFGDDSDRPIYGEEGLTLVDVLVRAVRFQRRLGTPDAAKGLVNRLKIEERAQLVLNTAQEALEALDKPVRALIEMLAREAAEDAEAKNPLDWDLEPRWRDIPNQREIEIELGAIQDVIDDRRRLGLNRLKKLSYKRPYGPDFSTLNALRDFTEMVDCRVKDARPSHIALLAFAVLGAAIGPEQVQAARRKTAELNRDTAEFNRKVEERIQEAAGRNREAAEQLEKLFRQRQAPELRRGNPPLIDW